MPLSVCPREFQTASKTTVRDTHSWHKLGVIGWSLRVMCIHSLRSTLSHTSMPLCTQSKQGAIQIPRVAYAVYACIICAQPYIGPALLLTASCFRAFVRTVRTAMHRRLSSSESRSLVARCSCSCVFLYRPPPPQGAHLASLRTRFELYLWLSGTLALQRSRCMLPSRSSSTAPFVSHPRSDAACDCRRGLRRWLLPSTKR